MCARCASSVRCDGVRAESVTCEVCEGVSVADPEVPQGHSRVLCQHKAPGVVTKATPPKVGGAINSGRGQRLLQSA